LTDIFHNTNFYFSAVLYVLKNGQVLVTTDWHHYVVDIYLVKGIQIGSFSNVLLDLIWKNSTIL